RGSSISSMPSKPISAQSRSTPSSGLTGSSRRKPTRRATCMGVPPFPQARAPPPPVLDAAAAAGSKFSILVGQFLLRGDGRKLRERRGTLKRTPPQGSEERDENCMPTMKPDADKKPFIFGKNLGVHAEAEYGELTRTNADGLPAIELTEAQRYCFDTYGWLLV